MSTCALGRISIMTGHFAEGLAQLDDSMVRVVAGELSPMIAGHVYCTAIEGAQEISDFVKNPKAMVPDSPMALAFQGIPDAGERADIIAYVKTFSK